MHKVYLSFSILTFALFSCNSSPDEITIMEPTVETSDIQVTVSVCDGGIDPTCFELNPAPASTLLLFRAFDDIDDDTILSEGSTDNDGQFRFSVAEFGTYYVLSEYQNRSLLDSVIVIPNSTVSFLEMIYVF